MAHGSTDGTGVTGRGGMMTQRTRQEAGEMAKWLIIGDGLTFVAEAWAWVMGQESPLDGHEPPTSGKWKGA